LTLVQPEIATQQSLGLLNRQVRQQGTAIAEGAAAEAEPVTGHAVGFMTHKRYFQTMGSGGGGTARVRSVGPRGPAAPLRPGNLTTVSPAAVVRPPYAGSGVR